MGRRRKTNKHLPLRVYERRGKLYYDHPVLKKWIQLKEGLKTWAQIVEASDPATTCSILFAQFDLEVLSKRAAKTRRNRLQEWSQLEPVFGAVNPADVEPHHVWRYFRGRGETEGARHEVRCLSALLTYARQTGARTTPNPCFGLRLPSGGPRDRYVTDEEFLAVRQIASDMGCEMVCYAMDLTLLTAMSQIDILQLERRQLIADGVLFDRQKTGKGQLVEWDDDFRALVFDRILKATPGRKKMIEGQENVRELRRFLIVKTRGRSGAPYTSQGFATIWQRIMNRAMGVKRPDGSWEHEPVIQERFTFHDLRAKSLSDAKSLEEAQKRGGHSDSKLTKRVYRRLPTRSQPLQDSPVPGVQNEKTNSEKSERYPGRVDGEILDASNENGDADQHVARIDENVL